MKDDASDACDAFLHWRHQKNVALTFMVIAARLKRHKRHVCHGSSAQDLRSLTDSDSVGALSALRRHWYNCQYLQYLTSKRTILSIQLGTWT